MNKKYIIFNISILVVLFLLLKGCWLLFPRVFLTLEFHSQDLMVQIAHSIGKSQTISPDIVYVDIDDKSLPKIPYSINDIELYSSLVTLLDKAGAAVQLIDMVFFSKEGTDILHESIKGAGNVYLPLVFSTSNVKMSTPVPAVAEKWVSAEGNYIFPKGSPIMASRESLNISAAGLGHINCWPDVDGVYRRMPLFINYGGKLVPTLSLQAAIDYLNVSTDNIRIKEKTVVLADASFPDGRVANITIPYDKQGKSRIHFIGPWPFTFAHYSVATLLETNNPLEEQLLRDEFEGSLVIISDVTTGGRDFGPTPFSSYSPLSGIHAHFLNSLLANTFLKEASSTLILGVEMVMILILVVFTLNLRGYYFLAGVVITYIFLIVGSFVLFSSFHLIIPIVLPSIFLTLGTIIILLSQFVNIQQEKRVMKARLTPYFAPSVMDKILISPDILSNVSKKTLTILFSDIVAFSDWSSTKEANEIHETLNRYFYEMSSIVFSFEGTLDKFMGDGMLAFFGDPSPCEDHAQRAVQTALAMQKKAWELKQEWSMTGGMRIRIRIGIHTDEVVVGNMGSIERMDYTVIGSGVNLAQRLESNCMPDRILVSRQVHDQLDDTFVTSPGGGIQVKGFTEPIEVYYVDRCTDP